MWTLTLGDEVMSAVTAEVAHRQADGGWRYVIDHPYASLESAVTANVARRRRWRRPARRQ